MLACTLMVSLIHEEAPPPKGVESRSCNTQIRDPGSVALEGTLRTYQIPYFRQGKQGLPKGQWLTQGHTAPARRQDSSSAPVHSPQPLPLPLTLTTSHNLHGQTLQEAPQVAAVPRWCQQVYLSTGQGQGPYITLGHTVKPQLKKEITE